MEQIATKENQKNFKKHWPINWTHAKKPIERKIDFQEFEIEKEDPPTCSAFVLEFEDSETMETEPHDPSHKLTTASNPFKEIPSSRSSSSPTNASEGLAIPFSNLTLH